MSNPPIVPNDRPATQSNDRGRTKVKYKAGKITRNPFLNFLRDYRKKNKELKVTEITKRGAVVWRQMNPREKSPYFSMAKQAPFKKYKKQSRKKPKEVTTGKRSSPEKNNSKSVPIKEHWNRFPFHKDNIAKPPDSIDVNNNNSSSKVKIIELPSDHEKDSGQVIEVIDLT